MEIVKAVALNVIVGLISDTLLGVDMPGLTDALSMDNLVECVLPYLLSVLS